jgi:hypothetical protein
MNLVSPSTVARYQAVVLIPTAMETSVHSLSLNSFLRFPPRTILVSTAHSRPSMRNATGKIAVALAPSPTRSTFFAHGEKRDFSSRTRGLAQPDV